MIIVEERVGDLLTLEEMESVGLENVLSGHRLKIINEYGRWDCECGRYSGYFRLLASGMVSKHAVTQYNNHVELMSTAGDTLIHVGSIIKPRVTWKLNVFTSLHPECKTYGTNSWREQWLYGENRRVYWICGAEKKKNSRILGMYESKLGAVLAAHREMDKAYSQGFKVERAFTLHEQVEAVTHSASDELYHLLSRVDESESVATKLALLEQLQDVENLMPVIQAKTEQLRKELNLLDGLI